MSECWTYQYAEGEAHLYTGTCEIYDGYAESADGNNGWSCYTKDKCSDYYDNNNYDGGDKDDGGNNDDGWWYNNDNNSSDFFYEGPYLCEIPWLNCSRQLLGKEIITDQWQYYGLHLQCFSTVAGLFMLELADVIRFYSECKGQPAEEEAECALRVFAADYTWFTNFDNNQ